jgi:hypothetical protein
MRQQGEKKSPYQGIYDDAVSIHKHLVQHDGPGLFHIIPSFLIANRGDKVLTDIAKRLLASGAAGNNWGKELAYVRQFGSDFFARLFSEARSYYEDGLARVRYSGEEPSFMVRSLEASYGATGQ